MNQIIGHPETEKGVVIGVSSVRIVDGKRIPQTGSIFFGKNVVIGANSCIAWGDDDDHPTRIKDNVIIGPMVSIAHGSIIREGAVLLGGCLIAGYADIGEGAMIGMGAYIRNRIKIGKGSVIGIGAVVVNDVPPGEIWIGNPAHRYKKVDR